MLMGEVMREAAFSLAEAKFTAGDFRWGLLGFHDDVLPMGKSYQQIIIFSFGKKCRFLKAPKEIWQWTGWTEFPYVKVGEITCMMKTYTPLEAKQNRKIKRILFLCLVWEGAAFCSLKSKM